MHPDDAAYNNVQDNAAGFECPQLVVPATANCWSVLGPPSRLGAGGWSRIGQASITRTNTALIIRCVTIMIVQNRTTFICHRHIILSDQQASAFA